MIYGFENELVIVNLYKEYLLILLDVKVVIVQEVGLIVDIDNIVVVVSFDRVVIIYY